MCVEKLQIRNMTRSSRGGVGSVDRNARRKAALNRAILQQNWFEFRRQLAYKLAWRGGRLILVSPRYTSRTCPQCGFQSKENRTSPSTIFVPQLPLRGQCRSGRGNEYPKGGARPVSSRRYFAHRSVGPRARRRARFLSELCRSRRACGEDAKKPLVYRSTAPPPPPR